ncbi:MAG: phage late control D family protein, partial [Candidatus Nanopelagicales bacterium]
MAYDYDSSAATFKVWKSGKELPKQAQTAIRSVTVEAGINMPRMCEIEFLESPAYIGEQSGNLSTGAEIAVFAYAEGNVTGDVLFKGKIRTQEISFDEGMGVRTVFRAYDTAHDMLSATRTKMYKETTISEVVQTLAKKYGLSPLIGGAIASTKVKYDAIVQMNESDWDFICRLAREVGYIAYVRVFTQLTVSQTKLYFGPATKASKAPLTASRARGFKIGDGRIISLRAMVTGAGAPKEAVIPGWNEKAKAAAVGDQDLSSKMYETVDTRTSASSLRSSKAGKRMSLERVAGNVAEAEQMAKGYARRLAAATTDVELVVRGHPDA